ncbi:hypothetical protein [Sulfurovum mangrovi]|uniref:hypothetical protein n=1 Tax=Sulfurovum mangrovi TaxID=2893889 RepID=UPI001E494EBE|nr:hypothetical protein [Sulfurovum mangrovi]UFH58348.1 hypothetical protein LN246_08300 [Sulfurovum mangrovi]
MRCAFPVWVTFTVECLLVDCHGTMACDGTSKRDVQEQLERLSDHGRYLCPIAQQCDLPFITIHLIGKMQ